MNYEAIVTLIIIFIAIFLFITEWISIDLIALIIMSLLVVTGVISVEEGVEGFSNKATITVAFMFVLSATLMKTGVLQSIVQQFSKIIQKNKFLGLLYFFLTISLISAFINNTPVVAVFIPVGIELAKKSGFSPNKILIPISFASILGGMCTLIGTSTNILVNGIVEKSGLPSIGLFDMTYLGLIFLLVGIIYILCIGMKLIPERLTEDDLTSKFAINNYLTEVQLTEESESINKKIMDSDLVKKYEVDIIAVYRDGQSFQLPQGDFILRKEDVLKISCNVEKLKQLNNEIRISFISSKSGTQQIANSENSTLVELIIPTNSEMEGKTLKEIDFRRRYRATPLAIKDREEIVHDHIYTVPLKAGDLILAEIKNHYLKELKQQQIAMKSPFIVTSENSVDYFNKKNFYIVLATILSVIFLATFNVLDIMFGAIIGSVFLVLMKVINMKELYESISWKIIFLIAGTLTLGTAMKNSGLDLFIASELINQLGSWGPIAVLSGFYLVSSLLTEIMSNNATAALLTPLAITIAAQLNVSPLPFVMAVMMASSASFLTPIGYQTNSMVYNAGNYKFTDFFRIGFIPSILFWIIATLVIPVLFPF